jgi:O-antigen/teichoic acid export membrane protein
MSRSEAPAGATTRRRAVVWGMLFGYGAIAVALVRNILLVPIYLRYIDLSEFGAWLASGGALAQILVADFGLTGVLTQRVAHRFGANDHDGLGPLIGAGLANGAALGALLTGLCLLLITVIPATDGLSPAAKHRVIQCFVVAVCSNGIGVLASSAAGIVRSLQKAAVAGATYLIADVLSIAVTVGALLLSHLGLYAIAFGLLARSALIAVSSLGVLGWLGHRYRALRPRFNWQESRALWRDSAHFFLTSVAMKLQTNANTLFVGMVVGPAAAATYGLTVRAHETVLMLLGQFNSALGPSLAHLVGENQIERFRSLLMRLLPATAAVAAIGMTMTATLNPTFVRLWVGPAAFAGSATSILMAAALWTASIAYVAYDSLLARGEFRFISTAFIVSSGVHLIAVFLLLPFGVWGAPVAVLAATLCWGGAMWWRIASASIASVRELAELGRECAVIAAIATAVGGLLFALYPAVIGWPGLLGEAIVGVFAVTGALLASRPPLRHLVQDELSLTLRTLRQS